MKRVLTVFAVGALMVAGMAGTAKAAPPTHLVERFRFHGTFAQADWDTVDLVARSDAITTVVVSSAKDGSSLLVDREVQFFDEDFNVTSRVSTTALVTEGFTFTIDAPTWTAASVTASGIPGSICTYEAPDFEENCTDTTMDVAVTWTGQGPIARTILNQLVKIGGFSQTMHSNMTGRNATATGTVAGFELPASDLLGAALGKTNDGTIIRKFEP